MNDNEIRVIGGTQKKYFCRAFAANCPWFEENGLCGKDNCIHADENIPSSDEMLRSWLLQMRRTQLSMAGLNRMTFEKIPRWAPKTR